ncbi:non-canonical purine NTP pyrophosphatase, partial [candidate division GN15 bacterium]|nr:non-canonical purine NTP pyrophosphatase [candidate division GN15 bacterium]
CTYQDNNNKLLDMMKSIPDERRTARFRCVICLWWDQNEQDLVEGAAEGFITREIGGKEGFGYDPVFYYPPADKRFSEMSLEEKNAISHRGKALTLARDKIIERLNRPR